MGNPSLIFDRTAFRYILRYEIDPLFNADERIEELLRFCNQARIEEVMLFILAEELTTGHPTLEELAPYVGMAKQLKAKLQDQGVGLSLNPWATTYPAARGRTLKAGQDFILMVGENGVLSPICACPLCPSWQAYICEVFSYLAREIKPLALWVEDDWRLHNHDLELGWGGCFCRLHLQRLAKIIGREVSRQKLLENILAPGKPHPWRKIWLDICRDSLLEPAVKLRQAVQKANPSTRLGLMSSLPDVHSIEGRDWLALQQALGNKPAFLTRPNMPPYTETPAISTPPAQTRHTIANLEGPLEIYPELENSPRCGPYSKSGTYSLWECFNAAVLGSQGITINHFDMMGNGTALDRGFAAALAQAKPRLDALAKLGLDDRNAHGVRVLFSPVVAAQRHSTSSSSLGGLYNASTVWSQAFYILGIAHCFCKKIEADGTPYAVNDQTLRAFDDQTIKKLLSGPVLLDASSIEILLERGFGRWIGIESAQWCKITDPICAYESVAEEDCSVFGLANPRMTAQRCADKLLDFKPAQGAQVRSWICNPVHKRLFPGAVSFSNQSGGRCVSLAYPLDGQAQFFMGFFNCFRRIMLQRILLEIAPEGSLAMAEDHPMHLYRTSTSEGVLFAAFNVVTDTAQRVVLRVPKEQISYDKLERLDADGKWQPANVQVSSDEMTERIIVNSEIAPLEGLFLLAR
jgi:hypothetical protein